MKKIILSAAILAALGLSTSVFAAQDSADINISTNVSAGVTVTKTVNSDINLGDSWDGIAAVAKQTGTLCMYTNNTGNAFNVTLSAPNGFFLTHATEETAPTIPYNISFTPAGAGAQEIPVTSGKALAGVQGSATIDCSGNNELSSIHASLPAQASQALSGNYSSTVTVLAATE
jgi:hypothetical protein